MTWTRITWTNDGTAIRLYVDRILVHTSFYKILPPEGPDWLRYFLVGFACFTFITTLTVLYVMISDALQ